MNDIINLIRSDLRSFSPYKLAYSEYNGEKLLLNANELPWENNFFAVNVNRYPKITCEIIEKLAAFYKVNEDQLLLTRGSNEAIDLCIRLFCTAYQDAILINTPTFEMYKTSAMIQGAKIIEVPLRDDFTVNIREIKDYVRNGVKIIFLCNPNNPTGTIVGENVIEEICFISSGKSVVVVDEAYVEFSSAKSLSDKIDVHKNLIILRTLSKAFGLAGSRVGVALANVEIIQWLRSIMQPYGLNSLSLETIKKTFSTENIEKTRVKIDIIKNERKMLEDNFKKFSFIHSVVESQANFILVKTREIKRFLDFMSKSNVLLRSYDYSQQLKDYIRVSVGSPEDNRKLLGFFGEFEKCKVE